MTRDDTMRMAREAEPVEKGGSNVVKPNAKVKARP